MLLLCCRLDFVKSSAQVTVQQQRPASSVLVEKVETLTLPLRAKWISQLDMSTLVSWQAIRGPPRGLVNLGNTCFLDASLQCLATTPAFCQLMQLGTVSSTKHSFIITLVNCLHRTMSQHSSLCKSEGEYCAFCVMERLVGDLMFRVDRTGAFAPNSIARNISALGRQFRVGRQEDSHEFIRCLLERMCRASLRVAGVKEGAANRLDETTALHQVFGGYFQNQVHCTMCGFDSNSFDSFLDLSLEVGQDLPSVGAALRHFSKPETLDAKNMWKCPHCKVPVRAVKQMTIRQVLFKIVGHWRG